MINPLTGCREWTGSRETKGYGHLNYKGKMVKAHRAAWETAHGPIPPGMHVCHRCDNPPCINVDHLFLATNDGNVADKVAKGRQARGDSLKTSMHGKLGRLTVEQVMAIRAATGGSQREIGKRFGVSQMTVSDIKRGRRWGWL